MYYINNRERVSNSINRACGGIISLNTSLTSIRSLDTINITLIFEQNVQIIEQKDHMFIKHYGSNNYISNIL